MDQRTAEWFLARCGKVTASRFSDVLAVIKTGEAAVRRNYRAQLVVERLTKEPTKGYVDNAMKWGTEQEPFAKIAYMATLGEIPQEVGFIQHPVLQAGASPDGLVGDDGLIEIKCPYQSAVHIDTLKSKVMPKDHIAQVQGQMWIANRKWVDFVSYDPRMPAPLQLFVHRIYRDDDFISRLDAEIRDFLAGVDAEYNELMNMMRAA